MIVWSLGETVAPLRNGTISLNKSPFPESGFGVTVASPWGVVDKVLVQRLYQSESPNVFKECEMGAVVQLPGSFVILA